MCVGVCKFVGVWESLGRQSVSWAKTSVCVHAFVCVWLVGGGCTGVREMSYILYLYLCVYANTHTNIRTNIRECMITYM